MPFPYTNPFSKSTGCKRLSSSPLHWIRNFEIFEICSPLKTYHRVEGKICLRLNFEILDLSCFCVTIFTTAICCGQDDWMMIGSKSKRHTHSSVLTVLVQVCRVGARSEMVRLSHCAPVRLLPMATAAAEFLGQMWRWHFPTETAYLKWMCEMKLETYKYNQIHLYVRVVEVPGMYPWYSAIGREIRGPEKWI